MLQLFCLVAIGRKSRQSYLGFYNPFPPREDQVLYNFAPASHEKPTSSQTHTGEDKGLSFNDP